MDLEIIILSSVNQRKTNITWYYLYVKSEKQYKWIYLQNRNKLTAILNKLMVIKGEKEAMKYKYGINRYILLYIT